MGEPLAHCQEGVLHCASADRATGLAVAAVSHAKDEWVGETGVVGYIAEGVLHSMVVTELAPKCEDLGAGVGGAGDSTLGGEVQRSAESIMELLSALR